MSKEKISTLQVLERWRRLEVDYAALKHTVATQQVAEQREASSKVESDIAQCRTFAHAKLAAPRGVSAEELRTTMRYVNVQAATLAEQQTKLAELQREADRAHQDLRRRLERQLVVKKLAKRTGAQVAMLDGRREQLELDERGRISRAHGQRGNLSK